MPDPIISDQTQTTPLPVFPEVPPDIPSMPQAQEPIDIPPIIESPKTPKKVSGRILATILGIFLLIGAVGAGVVLVSQKQLFQQKAAGNCPVINGCVADHPERRCNDQGQMCTYYIGEPGYEVGSCTSGLTGNAGCPSPYYCMNFGSCYACVQNSTCFWKGEDNCVADVSCGTPTYTPTPEPTPTHTATPTPTPTYGGCGAPCNDFDHCIPSLNCPGGPGGGRCVNGSCPEETDCVCATPTPTPTPGALRACNTSCQADSQCSTGYCITQGSVCRNHSCPSDIDCICAGTPTPTPTPRVTPTPTPTPFIAACSTVKAYDTNWNLLTGAQLSALSAGDVVIFAVSGTPASQIDNARFTINGVLNTNVILKEPGIYYIEYTIPTGVMSFTVTAQIHHVTLGWF